MKISEIVKNPKNPRKIKGEQLNKLMESIQRDPEFMKLRPIVIDENNMILGGNQRYTAIKKLGMKEIPDEWIARAENLTEEQRKRFILVDNGPEGMTGEWDFDALQAEWELPELESLGFDISEYETPQEPAEGLTDADEIPEEPEPVCKLGDLWRLGEHRLLCGDSTKEEDVNRLMGGEKATCIFTDPPYGVSIGKKNVMLNSFQKAGRNLDDITGDDLSPEELKKNLLPAFKNIKNIIMADDCSVYVTAPQGGDLGMMMMMMCEAGLKPRHVLMWLKNCATFSMGRLDYDYQHEPILFTWGKKHKKISKGQFHTSVWAVDKPRECKMHPTMKPVELVENAFLNSAEAGDIVFDSYTGSGTSLIAAEKTGMKFRGIELMPKYCDVIIKRWENFTGKKAERL